MLAKETRKMCVHVISEKVFRGEPLNPLRGTADLARVMGRDIML